MESLDLLQPFVSLIEEQQNNKPELHLEANLKKVSVALRTYAESLDCTLEELSILHVCVNEDTLHPDLIKHIDSLPESKEYKGQNRSRIKTLVKNLPWPATNNGEQTYHPAVIE